MDLEVVDALKSAGVPEDKARAVVVSLHREIDQRFALHTSQLATRGDLADVKVEMTRLHAESMAATAHLETRLIEMMAETKVELIRWFLGSLIATGGVVTAIVRLTGH